MKINNFNIKLANVELFPNPTWSKELVMLLNSEIGPKLYLTGSRYFKTHNENSDWDFFLVKNYLNIQTLESLGYMNIGKNDNYLTEDIAAVYRINILYKDKYTNIDIQLLQDEDTVIRKQKVQRLMKQYNILLPPKGHKFKLIQFWDMAMALAKK